MTAQKLTREQEIELAYAQKATNERKEKDAAWEKADQKLQHQQKQSV